MSRGNLPDDITEHVEKLFDFNGSPSDLDGLLTVMNRSKYYPAKEMVHRFRAALEDRISWISGGHIVSDPFNDLAEWAGNLEVGETFDDMMQTIQEAHGANFDCTWIPPPNDGSIRTVLCIFIITSSGFLYCLLVWDELVRGVR